MEQYHDSGTSQGSPSKQIKYNSIAYRPPLRNNLRHLDTPTSTTNGSIDRAHPRHSTQNHHSTKSSRPINSHATQRRPTSSTPIAATTQVFEVSSPSNEANLFGAVAGEHVMAGNKKGESSPPFIVDSTSLQEKHMNSIETRM